MRKKTLQKAYIILSLVALTSCASKKIDSKEIINTMNTTTENNNKNAQEKKPSTGIQDVYLGAGCFWCVEAQFDLLEGVEDVVSGYAGGQVKNPTYKEVCTGNTGHAEVIKVSYDPAVIPFSDLLQAFFVAHDPTTLNRQGNDVGTQYRSVIFYTDNDQKAEALEIIDQLNKAEVYPQPIVTEVSPFETFYPAEDYHQQYYELNGDQPYCRMVIQPKQEKFKKVFAEKLKKP